MTIDRAIHLPWLTRHSPFLALHVTRWGYDMRAGRERATYRVGLGCGRLFTDRGSWFWFDTRGRWVDQAR